MTQEELIKKIDAEIVKLSDNAYQMCMEEGGYRVACKDISDMLHDITKKIQPSLPSNLDEAAEEYYSNDYTSPSMVRFVRNAFKDGARWIAEQGYSQEEIVEDKSIEVGYGVLPGISPIINLPDSFKPGDKVIVQIRKKQ